MTHIEQIATILSPGFTTSYPSIYNPQMLSPTALETMEPIWRKGHYDEQQIVVHNLSNVYVAGDGVIFDSDLNALRQFVTQQSSEHINLACTDLQRSIIAGDLNTVKEDSMVLVKPGYINYGHWLIELLPQLLFMKKTYPGLNLLIYLADVLPPLGKIYRDTLLSAGFDIASVRQYDFTPKRMMSLFVVTGHSVHGPYMSPAIFDCLRACQESAAQRMSISKKLQGYFRRRPVRRVYVKRSPRYSRSIANEAEVTELLNKNGFKSIAPEMLSFDEQVRTFSDCDFTIGVAGAGLTNICWQNPGSACVALYPESMLDTFFWWICQHKAIRFTDVRCPVVGRGESDSVRHEDIYVSLSDLQSLINQVDSRAG